MSFVGLRSAVIYRYEVGFAFVDDGRGWWKLDEGQFRRLSDGSWVVNDARVPSFVHHLPSVFIAYPSMEKARESFQEQEV